MDARLIIFPLSRGTMHRRPTSCVTSRAIGLLSGLGILIVFLKSIALL